RSQPHPYIAFVDCYPPRPAPRSPPFPYTTLFRSLVDVDEVPARRLDLHDGLARFRLGLGNVLEALRLEDIPEPKPEAGQAVVKIEAAGGNFIDVYQRSEERRVGKGRRTWCWPRRIAINKSDVWMWLRS